MIGQDHPDLFEVLNGPEDGATFPLINARADMGSDPECCVLLRMDPGVMPRHARITVVSDGYRVRSLERPCVVVDGKPAGLIRSRIVRHGGVVRIGKTELALLCAPDGLASRSRGLPQESDLSWAIRVSAQHGASFFMAFWRGVRRLLGRLLVPVMLLVAVLVLIAIFLPGLFVYIRVYTAWAFGWITYYFGRMFS